MTAETLCPTCRALVPCEVKGGKKRIKPHLGPCGRRCAAGRAFHPEVGEHWSGCAECKGDTP